MGLLALTLFHSLRLERALGMLRRDKAALEGLVDGFNKSTRLAEGGIERLQAAADGAGRHIARQVDHAKVLKSDLGFLIERGEKLADQLDNLVRIGRPVHSVTTPKEIGQPHVLPKPRLTSVNGSEANTRVRSKAERELLDALRKVR